jgi:hypothetical protein
MSLTYTREDELADAVDRWRERARIGEERVRELRDVLAKTVEIVDAKGYMTHEQQEILRRARAALEET